MGNSLRQSQWYYKQHWDCYSDDSVYQHKQNGNIIICQKGQKGLKTLTL
jgi:hypothetical protein